MIALQIIGVCLLAASISCGRVPVALRSANLVQVEPPDAFPRYGYSYAINDGITGDSKYQFETRDGDNVQGEYSIVEPDGALRVVTYTSGPEGFNAVITRKVGYGPPNPIYQKQIVTPVQNTIPVAVHPQKLHQQKVQFVQQQPQPQPILVQPPPQPVIVEQPQQIFVEQEQPQVVHFQPQPIPVQQPQLLPQPIPVQQQPQPISVEQPQPLPQPIPVQQPQPQPIPVQQPQPQPIPVQQPQPQPIPVQQPQPQPIPVQQPQPQPIPVQQPQPRPIPVQQQPAPAPQQQFHRPIPQPQPQPQPLPQPAPIQQDDPNQADDSPAVVVEASGRSAAVQTRAAPAPPRAARGPGSFTYSSSRGNQYDFNIAY